MEKVGCQIMYTDIFHKNVNKKIYELEKYRSIMGERI
nr:MAG TPA: hypothetical protein [Caudoviricetes sp.]